MNDILVVGAGFVGLSFAIAAARQGFRVTVLDKRDKPAMPSAVTANVLALSPASSTFLKEIDVWCYLPPQCMNAYDRMSVYDGTGAGTVEFSAADAGLDALGHIVGREALIATLAEQAGQVEGLTVKWGAPAMAEVGDAPLLVGADGVHSSTRESLGLKKHTHAYDQTATVCVTEMEQPHGNCAYQWFLEKGPLAFLPLSDAHSVAIVWSSFEDLGSVAEDEFIRRLPEASEGRLGKVIKVSPRFSFPLVQQQALQYVAEGVALLGDAAHAIHPLAGQGANLGFADARALVTEICAARLESRPPGDLQVLKRYESARKTENYLAGVAMEGFHRLFTSGSPLIGLLRSQGLRLVNGSSTLKKLAINIATGRTQS